jgi:hypothetical protein
VAEDRIQKFLKKIFPVHQLKINIVGYIDALCLGIKPGWSSMSAENYIYPALHETKARGNTHIPPYCPGFFNSPVYQYAGLQSVLHMCLNPSEARWHRK